MLWRATIGLFNGCCSPKLPHNNSVFEILNYFLFYLKYSPDILLKILLKCLQLSFIIESLCLGLTILCSPFLILLYSILVSYPILCNLTYCLHKMDNIKVLFYNSFLYSYILLRFLVNLLSFTITSPQMGYKFLFNYCLLSQIGILLNPFLDYILLLCGDIESNPGPNDLPSQPISVCYWNVNGIAAHDYVKLSLLKAYNAAYNYDIICLGETYLNSSHLHSDQRINIQGYQLLRADHPDNTNRGGVSLYYKENLPLRIRNDISPLQECLVCEIKINKKKCFVSCLYRSPSQSSVEFDDFCAGLETTFSNLNLESPFCCIFLGDFNAKCSKWYGNNDDHCGLELESLTSSASYTQIIKEATHLLPDRLPSCIDLIFSNQPELVLESGVHASLYNTCHHQIIFAKINFKINLPPPYKRKVWEYKKAEVDLIKRSISKFKWVDAFRNIDTNAQVELFTTTLINIFNNFIPHKTITCNYRDPLGSLAN